MGSLGMLFYVVECFSVNLENLAADAVRSVQLCRIDQQIQGDRRFVAVAFSESAHQINQIGALYAERTEIRDGLAELRTLVLDGLLEADKAADGLVRRGGNAAPQHVQLDFDAQESLKNPVVEVAGNAAALGLDGAGA